MSYYVHPIFGYRSPSPTPIPAPNPYYPSSGYRHPHPHHYTHANHFGPTSGHDNYDLEAEERAALAHLRHIQRRREAEQAAIQREASIRLHQQEEREQAIRQAIAQKQREQAILAAIEQRKQEEAIRLAMIQQHRARQEQMARAKFEAYQQAKKQQFEQAIQRKVECAKRCAARYAQNASRSAAKEVKKEYKGEMEMLNGLLGGLFGINLKDEQEKEVPQPEEKKEEEVKTTNTTTPTAPEAAPAPAALAKTAEQSFPEDVNDLLSHFLGLRIEPTTATAPSTGQTDNKVPQGLNEFLSRFGLAFEPVDVSEEVKPESAAPAQSSEAAKTGAEKSTSTPVEHKTEKKVDLAPIAVADPPEPSLPIPAATASSSSSANKSTLPPANKEDHPLTTFLNGFTDMPPFVRDILGNVELAFKEEMYRDTKKKGKEEEAIKGKGKGVAEGEKKARAETVTAPVLTEAAPAESAPTAQPMVDPTSSALSTLSTLSDNLDHLRSDFSFPPTLSFAPSSSGTATPTPALLFNKTNSTYHAQAHNLLQLLLAADGVSSGGNKDVRRKRKEVVREVEKEIERLEKKRDEVWEIVKEQREKGEEEVDEEERSAGSSCGSSIADPEEGREVETEHVEVVEQAENAEDTTVPAGQEVKETYAEAVKEDQQEKEEEGYELL